MANSDETLKTMTISLPAAIAGKAEALAEYECRTVGEVLCEAFCAYQAARISKLWKDLDEDPSRNPLGYTEEDIPSLTKEFRAERAAETASHSSAKAS